MSRGTTARMRKVNETLREVVADEIHELKDPRVGFVTVTGVDTSPDLRHARVYYSVLGDEDEAAATREALQHSAPHIQAGIARQVRLKYVPKLHFAVDESIELGLRIDHLLRGIEEENERDDPGADPTGG